MSKKKQKKAIGMESAWRHLVRAARSNENDDLLFDKAVCALKVARAMKKRGMTAPSFGGGELSLVWNVATTQDRGVIRRVLGAVVTTVLAGDAAAQGRALASGTAKRRDDWLVVGEGAGIATVAPAAPPLPEGVKDRELLMEIRTLPDPLDAEFAVELCECLRLTVPPTTAPAPADTPPPPPKRESELWRGDTTVQTTSGRKVEASIVASIVAVGAVAGDDTDDHRATPSYLCCARVGDLVATGGTAITVVRLRLASQGDTFDVYVSRPVLDEEALLEPLDEYAIKALCESRVRLPWFSGDDPALPVWRHPPKQGLAHKVAGRCIQLLAAAAGRSATIQRAVLLAVVAEVNKALLNKPGCGMRKIVECRDTVVEALKQRTLSGLGDDNGQTIARSNNLEAVRLKAIDTLLRVASDREDPPEPSKQQQQQLEDEDSSFSNTYVVLGRTKDEDRVQDGERPKSPVRQDVAAVINRAEMLAHQDRVLRDRKKAARVNSAKLMHLRQRAMNQSEEYRRSALERCLDYETGYAIARRARSSTVRSRPLSLEDRQTKLIL